VERKGKNGAKDQRQFKSFEDTVFPEELALLKGRSSAATRSPADPSGLPDFKSRLIPNAGRSPFLQHTLTLLEDGDQNDLWEAWAGEQAEKRHKGLTGLALSGGGIRSSTLNLGIIQVLDKIGLFQCLDYLSTVSGGGYVGSSISANYSPPERKSRAGQVQVPLPPRTRYTRARRFPAIARLFQFSRAQGFHRLHETACSGHPGHYCECPGAAALDHPGGLVVERADQR
jgi:hypothetical protein